MTMGRPEKAMAKLKVTIALTKAQKVFKIEVESTRDRDKTELLAEILSQNCVTIMP